MKSEFKGSTWGLIGQILLFGLINSVTAGIALPWALCGLWGWIIKNTVVSGKALKFTGTGGSLFGNYIKWFLLNMVTCGIYGLWVPKKLVDWVAVHTEIAE